MLVSLLAAVVVVAFIFLFLRLGRAPKRGDARDERPRIPPPTFRAVVIDLLRHLGLDIVEEELRGHERRLVAVRNGKPEAGRCLVFVESAPPDDLVRQTLLYELVESVRDESGGVGLLVTPYQIEVATFDAPVELVDGPKLR